MPETMLWDLIEDMPHCHYQGKTLRIRTYAGDTRELQLLTDRGWVVLHNYMLETHKVKGRALPEADNRLKQYAAILYEK